MANDDTEPTLVIEQGVNADYIFEPFDDDEKTIRTTLEGYRVVLQARTRRGAAGLILDLDTADADGRLTIEDATEAPVGKVVRMHLDAADTLLVQRGGEWELARIDPDDETNVDPLGNGILELEKQVLDPGA